VADGVRIVLGEHAVDDLRRARDHYSAIDPALSDDFANAFDAVIERIRIFPHGAPPVDGLPGLRRARMRRFPYGVFYRDTDENLIVVRVLHNARDTVPQLP
jgi:plasmid stabilization system protein ParE